MGNINESLFLCLMEWYQHSIKVRQVIEIRFQKYQYRRIPFCLFLFVPLYLWSPLLPLPSRYFGSHYKTNISLSKFLHFLQYLKLVVFKFLQLLFDFLGLVLFVTVIALPLIYFSIQGVQLVGHDLLFLSPRFLLLVKEREIGFGVFQTSLQCVDFLIECLDLVLVVHLHLLGIFLFLIQIFPKMVLNINYIEYRRTINWSFYCFVSESLDSLDSLGVFSSFAFVPLIPISIKPSGS